jgi:undecaprenyl-diphosphatase
LIFGLALGWADRLPASKRTLDLGWKGALGIGAAQAFALIPGVSRSGVAMTAARALQLTREEAARFALLLAIPTIAGAGALAGVELWQGDDVRLGADAALGATLSFAAAYAAIWLMMRWLRRASFMPFVVYRVALGLALLAVAYG